MSDLIFTVARGGSKYREMGLGLGRSLRLLGGSAKTAILTDIDEDWSRYFDVVIRPPGPRSALDKLLALDVTEADRIVAIDCDCLVCRPLEPIFAHCEGMPFAVQGDAQSSGIWHGAEVAELCRKFGRTEIPRFNGGFLYYERQPDTQRLIMAMRETERSYADSGFAGFRGNPSEEVCILLAMMATGVGEVIPDDTDFMSTAVGLVGRLDIDVREGRCRFLCRRARMRSVRPLIFHASRYSNFLVYWRELARLRKLFGG